MGSKICSQLICILSAHFQLGFSSKLKCPSSARLGSENFQLGLELGFPTGRDSETFRDSGTGKTFLSRDRGFCPGTFAPAPVPGQRDNGTRKNFCPGTKGQRDGPSRFVPSRFVPGRPAGRPVPWKP